MPETGANPLACNPNTLNRWRDYILDFGRHSDGCLTVAQNVEAAVPLDADKPMKFQRFAFVQAVLDLLSRFEGYQYPYPLLALSFAYLAWDLVRAGLD